MRTARTALILPVWFFVGAAVPMPSPPTGLIDKGEIGIAFYGMLFVIVALIAFCGVLLRSLSGRDKLIESMVNRAGESAEKTANAMQTLAVQVALNTQAAGARPVGKDDDA